MPRGTADWSRKRPLIRYTTGDDVDELAYRINERIDEIRDHISSTTADIRADINAAADEIRDHISSTTADIRADINAAADEIVSTVSTTSAEIRDAVVSTAEETRDAVVEEVRETLRRLGYYPRLDATGRTLYIASGDEIPDVFMITSYGSGVSAEKRSGLGLWRGSHMLLIKTNNDASYIGYYKAFQGRFYGAKSVEADLIYYLYPVDVSLTLYVHDGSYSRRAELHYDSVNYLLRCRTTGGAWHTISTNVRIPYRSGVVFPMKVVVKEQGTQYVRAVFGNMEYDISSVSTYAESTTIHKYYEIGLVNGLYLNTSGRFGVASIAVAHMEI